MDANLISQLSSIYYHSRVDFHFYLQYAVTVVIMLNIPGIYVFISIV